MKLFHDKDIVCEVTRWSPAIFPPEHLWSSGNACQMGSTYIGASAGLTLSLLIAYWYGGY